MNTIQSRLKEHVNSGKIDTQNGSFNLRSPFFKIEDIAHSLSNICRFNGHTKEFYSVAEHSMLVAYLMEKFQLGNPYEGLMHDAHESYISDLSSPWKPITPDYQLLERAIEEPLRKWANLPTYKTKECTECDWLALFIEAILLLPDQGKGYEDPFNLRPKALDLVYKDGIELLMFGPGQSRVPFLDSYFKLKSGTEGLYV